jgi:hypothetical protein
MSEIDRAKGAKLDEEPMRLILTTLISVYQTLSACVDGGAVKLQLGHKYSKTIKATMADEFSAHLASLLASVVEQVMTMASHSAGLRPSATSPIERVQLAKLPDAARSGCGAMSYKAANFQLRDESANPTRITFMRSARPPTSAAHRACACVARALASATVRHRPLCVHMPGTEAAFACVDVCSL